MKDLAAERFRKALPIYDDNALAQRIIVQRLLALSSTLYLTPRSHLASILEIGCGTGLLSKRLLQTYQIAEYTLNDLCPEAIDQVITSLRDCSTSWTRRAGNADTLLLHPQSQESYALIASSSTLQWLESPLTFLSNAIRSLTPGGLLLISTFAPGNLQEFTTLTGRGLTYLSAECIKTHIQQTEAIEQLTILEEQVVLTFESPQTVLKHLRNTGVTGTAQALQDPYWTPRRYEAFCLDYQGAYSTPEHTVRLTYKPLYILGRKKYR